MKIFIRVIGEKKEKRNSPRHTGRGGVMIRRKIYANEKLDWKNETDKKIKLRNSIVYCEVAIL